MEILPLNIITNILTSLPLYFNYDGDYDEEIPDEDNQWMDKKTMIK